MKNSFILYQDQEEVFTALPKDKAGELIIGVFEYQRTGEIPKFDSINKIAFIPIKQKLDADKLKYDAKCLKNKENIEKRWNTEDTNVYERIPSDTKNTDIIHNHNHIHNSLIKYGLYKRVILSNKQYEKLVKDFTKEVIDNQIALLDEYVQSNDNKFKYKDFNLVLRKSIRENWFKDKPYKPIEQVHSIEPEWYGKEIIEETLSADEEAKMKAMLSEFK